tara:strand:+ start:432 stop:1799 length:1368 start_codon:yes stop_codon:yes gene_type:complete
VSELPKSWLLARLGDFAYVKNGFAFKSKDYIAAGTDTVPVIRISDIQNEKADTVKASHVHKDNAQQDFLIEKDDLLIAMSGATTGKTGVYKSDVVAYQNQRVGNIKLHSKLLGSNTYKNYLIASLSEDILKKAYGAAQPNISGKSIEDILVAIAPLNEQIRIADKLDSMLAKVDAAQARLDKIPNILKRFRQSVLAAATSGELTKEWRGQHNEKLTYKLLGDTGVSIKTGPFGSALHKSDYINNGISVINPMHINDGIITPRDSMSITLGKFNELQAWHLRVGDIILGRRGEMGRAAEVKNIKKGMLCGTGSMVLRVNDSGLLPSYLCLILRSQNAVNYFTSNSVGSTMVNLNQKIIKGLSIHFPSFEEQNEIFRRVESLFIMADTAEKQYSDAKVRINRLTQSILAKAFRGELVTQDESDEPASVLLARIQAVQDNGQIKRPKNSTLKKKADHG